MDAREGKLEAVADAAQREKDEAAKFESDVWNYSLFLYVGVVVGTLAPKVVAAKAPPPDAVASALRFLLAGGYDLSLTVAFLTTATLLLQAKFARVLLPPPRVHRLTTPMAWSLGIVTAALIPIFFVHCLTFGDEIHGGYGEWVAAAGAFVANSVMSARTVRRHLA